jgi:hypothetical protein
MSLDLLMPGHRSDGAHAHTIRVLAGTNERTLAHVTRDVLDVDYHATVQWLDVDTAFAYGIAESAARLVMNARRSSTVFVPEQRRFTFSNALRLDLFGELGDVETDADGFAVGHIG